MINTLARVASVRLKQGEHGNRPRVICSTHKGHRDAHALSKHVSSISWLPVANPYAFLKCFLITLKFVFDAGSGVWPRVLRRRRAKVLDLGSGRN